MRIDLQFVTLGAVGTLALTLTLGVVTMQQAIRLEGVDAIAQRDAPRTLASRPIRLEPVVVTAHKTDPAVVLARAAQTAQ